MKGQKKKALWAKKRAANAEARAAEKKANTARAFRKPRGFVEFKPKESKYVITEGMKKVAEAPSASSKPKKTKMARAADHLLKTRDPEEYARREAAAKVETDRKKKNVAPLANKMGYQYIGDAPPEIIKDLGKKV